MGEIPSPIPPKTIFKGETAGAGQERSPLVVLALQFFVIPLLIVLFCVGLYFIFRWLTYERRDVNDYLGALNARSPSRREEAAFALLNYIQEAKRWQSLSDLNDQLRFDREKFLRENPEVTPKLIQAFEAAKERDPKVAQYLSQVLATIGGPEASQSLLDALSAGGPADEEIFFMIGLGRLGEKRAVPLILKRLESDDAGVRYAALFALGFFDEEQAVDALKKKLNDPDPLADWNAAFSLARLSAKTGKPQREAVPVLKRLLDAAFVEKVAKGAEGQGRGPVLSRAQTEFYRVRAVQLLGIYLDEGLRTELKKVAESDPQLGVRQAAMDVLAGKAAAVEKMDFSGK